MSLMTTRLGARHIESCVEYDTGSLTRLADLTRGTRARIIEVRDEGDPASARRLFDLGFAPGVEVLMLRRAPLADPVVFRIAGYEIALRRAQARCIIVAPAS